MTVAVPGQTPAILGFVLPAGLGLVLAATLLLSYPPRDPPVEEAGTEMPAEDLTQIYIALEEPLFVSMGTGPKMKLELAVTVAGTGEQLLELNAAVTEQKSRVTAAILAEAQGLILDGAKSGEVLTDLPRRARMAINGILGSDEFPEPVTEVLILSLAMQG